MNWEESIEHLWRSPYAAIGLTLAVAAVLAVLLLVVVLRTEKTVANGALAVIALLGIVFAVAAGTHGSAPQGAGREATLADPVNLAAPALACLDDLAGDVVLAACEKQLFGSPDVIAAAVSATAARIARLTALGDVAAADRVMTPELAQLRRSVERDRYGLVAYVLASRDRCQPGQCEAFRSLTDHNQISANIEERFYEAAIGRYAARWIAPSPDAAPMAPGLAGLPTVAPTGRPTNAEFPTSASIPPVNIMTPEPATPSAAARSPASNPPATAAAPRAATPAAAPRAATPPAAANAQLAPRPATPPPAAKKPPPAKRPAAPAAPAGPVQLAPAAAGEDN